MYACSLGYGAWRAAHLSRSANQCRYADSSDVAPKWQPAGCHCRCNRHVAEARLTGPLYPSLHFPGEMGLLWGMAMVSIGAGHDLAGSRSGTSVGPLQW